MPADAYFAERQELLAGVYEPSHCRPIYAPVADGSSNEPSGLAVSVSFERYPKLEEIFRPIADGHDHITLGKHRWRPLAPPGELYGPEHPILLRLDLAFVEPARMTVPLIFKLETSDDYANLMAVAISGLVILGLTDAPPELEDEVLTLVVGWDELRPRLEKLVETGVLRLE